MASGHGIAGYRIWVWELIAELRNADPQVPLLPHQPPCGDSIATSASGNVAIAAWERGPIGNHVIEARVFSGGVWQPITQVSGVGVAAQSVTISMSSDGARALAVWSEVASGKLVAKARFWNSGTWGSSTTISSLVAAPDHIYSPHAALSADGTTAVAVWSQDVGVYNQIRVTRFSGGVWSAPALLSQLNIYGYIPKAAISANGSIATVAQLNGSVWGAGVNISDVSRDSNGPSVVLAANGDGAAIFMTRTDGGNDTVQFAALTGGVWSPPVQISAAGGDADSALVAINSTASVGAALWTRFNGTSDITQGAAFAPTPSPIPAKLAQSVTAPPKKLKVGKRKSLAKKTKQVVPVKWKVLTKKTCTIKSGKLRAKKVGRCKVRATAGTNASYLGYSRTFTVKIVR